ncbi:NUDIX domain-containing protein [Nakamurella lactea]|uniref:NUDIX domain-containing protein n=1 Tax=Nakamurella lactea TaxID=459515 RepID=UPI0006890B92|nr:NUDIX domain-containing protein [Nakamurella lactea]
MDLITRAIAVGLPCRDGHVLVSEGRDRRTGREFFRALGGGIETGETGDQALRREFNEELGVQLDQVDFLGTAVTRFEFEGTEWHETAHIFAVESSEISAMPIDVTLRVRDNGDLVRWVALDPIEPANKPLYPTPSMHLLRTHRTSSTT